MWIHPKLVSSLLNQNTQPSHLRTSEFCKACSTVFLLSIKISFVWLIFFYFVRTEEESDIASVGFVLTEKLFEAVGADVSMANNFLMEMDGIDRIKTNSLSVACCHFTKTMSSIGVCRGGGGVLQHPGCRQCPLLVSYCHDMVGTGVTRWWMDYKNMEILFFFFFFQFFLKSIVSFLTLPPAGEQHPFTHIASPLGAMQTDRSNHQRL